jgi:hypothetical protein
MVELSVRNEITLEVNPTKDIGAEGGNALVNISVIVPEGDGK